jgi:hypothetical protein
MAEINPLAFVGRSNDPSLTQRTVGASKALSDLQRGHALQTLSNRGAMDVQGLRNTGARDTSAIGAGFLNAADLLANQAELAPRRELKDLIGAGEGIAKVRRGGLKPTFPKGGATALDLLRSNLTLGDFPGQAAERIKVKAKETTGTEIETEEFTVPDASAPGGRRVVPLPSIRKKKSTQKSERESKGGNLFEVTLDVLENIGLKRGSDDGGKTTIIYRILDNGEADIIARQ